MGVRGGLISSALRARAQSLPCAVAQGYQHQREGEAGCEGGRLRGHETAAEQQHDGDEPLEDAPERALGDRRVQLATGGDGVDDQRSGVGGGDKEHQHQHEAEERRDVRQRQRLQHGEQGDFRLLCLHCRDHVGIPAVEVLRHGGPAESIHPDRDHQRRDDQHAGNQFAYCPAARDPGNKQADEGGPRNPPGPVKCRPSVYEVEVLAAHPVTERSDRRQILAEAGYGAGGDVARWPKRQHEHQQQ